MGGWAQIRFDGEDYTLDGERLHCGDALEVLIVDGLDGEIKVEQSRFELDGEDNPFLPGLLGYQVNGLFARLP